MNWLTLVTSSMPCTLILSKIMPKRKQLLKTIKRDFPLINQSKKIITFTYIIPKLVENHSKFGKITMIDSSISCKGY